MSRSLISWNLLNRSKFIMMNFLVTVKKASLERVGWQKKMAWIKFTEVRYPRLIRAASVKPCLMK